MGNRYLFVINSLGGGGAERVVTELSNYISNVKHDKVIIYLLESDIVAYKLDPNVEVMVSPIQKYCKGVFKLLLIPVNAYFLSKKIKEFHITSVMSFLHRSNLTNSISSFFQNREFNFSERSLISKSYNGFSLKVMTTLLKYAYLYSKNCIAISSAVHKELNAVGLPSDRICVINNPVFIEKKYQAKKINCNLKFCTAGRLVKNKNVNIIVMAFKLFLEFHSNATLNIYGAGPEFNKIVNLTERLGIQHKVIFHGFSENLEVDFSENDCFLFASEYESFGNVIIEAASVGLPIILPNDLHSLEDIFPDRASCIAYSERSPEKICSAMKEILCSKRYQELSEDSIRSSKRFNKETILEQYIKILGG